MNLLHVGGTMTGGSTVALTPAGITAPGKSTFVASGHTLLAPKKVDFLSTPPRPQKLGDAGTARSGFKIAVANVVAEEGCCTTTPGTVIIDVAVRWPLSQPQSVVDEALNLVGALTNSPEFLALARTGVLPVA